MRRFFLSLLLLSLLPFLSGATKNAWDIWREGYETYQKGEAARDRGEYTKASELFRKSLELYRDIQRLRPDWDQNIIGKRIGDSERELNRVRQLLGAEAIPEEPILSTRESTSKGVDFVEQESRRRELEVYQKKLAELTVESDQLRKENERLKANEVDALKLLREQRILRENITLLEQQNRTLEKQLKEPDTRLEELRKQLVEEKLAAELLAKRLQLAEARGQKLDKELLELSRGKHNADAQAKASGSEAERLNREMEELRRFQEGAVKQRVALEAVVKEAELKLKNQAEKLNAQTSELAELNRRLAEAAAAGGGAGTLNAELLAENAKFKAEVVAGRKALDTSAEEFLALQNKHRAAQLEVVQQKETLLRIDAMRLSLEKGNSALAKELEREKSSAGLSAVELQNLRERNAKLEEDMKSWSKRSAQLEAKLKNQNTATTSGIARSEEENKKLTVELRSLKDQLKTQDEELKVLSTQSSSRAEALEAANTELTKNKSALLLAEEKLETAKQTEARLTNAELELEKFRKDVPAMRKELAASQEIAEELKVSKTTLQAAQAQMKELEKLSNRLLEEQKTNQTLSEEIVKLQAELRVKPVGIAQPAIAEPLPPLELSHVAVLVDRKPAELIAAGKTEAAAERWELAIWNYEAALAQEPENRDAAALLGELTLQRGEYAKAEALLAKAIRRNPSDPTLASLYASALIGLGKFGNALSVLEAPLKLKPNDFQLCLAQAKALAGSGRKAAAIQAFRAVEKLNPASPEPYLELARLDLADGKEKEAAEHYRKARDLGAAPDSELEPRLGKQLAEQRELAEFMSTAAAEAAKGGDWTSALWYYRQLNEIDRGNQQIPLRMAFGHIQTENYAQALEILTLNPASQENDLLRIIAFLKQSDFVSAQKACEEALKRTDGKPVDWASDWPELKAEFFEQCQKPELGQSVSGMECVKLLQQLLNSKK